MRVLCITDIDDLPDVKAELASLGELCYHPEFASNQTLMKMMVRSLRPDIIFTNPNNQQFVLGHDILYGSTVQHIITASTGTDHIDFDACRNIGVTCLRDRRDVMDAVTSTAEHAFGLMMALLRHIPKAMSHARCNTWDWRPFIGRQVSSLTVGIVGYGRLGTLMAKYCDAFGAHVVVCDPYVTDTGKHENMELTELLAVSDVVSIHVHLNDETRALFNGPVLEHAKVGSYIVNTSRGDIVDEVAVVAALNAGFIAGYAADVVHGELSGDVRHTSPIVARMCAGGPGTVIITPHIGGMTREARSLAFSTAVKLYKEDAALCNSILETLKETNDG